MSSSVWEKIKHVPIPKNTFSFYYRKDCEKVVNSGQILKLSPNLPEYRLSLIFEEKPHRCSYIVERFDECLFIKKIKNKYSNLRLDIILKKYLQNAPLSEVAKDLGVTKIWVHSLRSKFSNVLKQNDLWGKIYNSTYLYNTEGE